MAGKAVQVRRPEAHEDVLARLPRRATAGNPDANGTRGHDFKRRPCNAVLRPGPKHGRGHASRIHDRGGDDVLPRGQRRVAVEEQEDAEERGHGVVQGAEGLIELVAGDRCQHGFPLLSA